MSIRSFLAAITVLTSALVGVPTPVRGASVTLFPSADTTLMEITPANNMGAVQSMAVGVTGHRTSARGLIKFDLNAVPTNATVTNMRLIIPVVQQSVLAKATTFDLHRMLVDWNEGDKGPGVLTGTGEAAGDGEATWESRRHPSTPWGRPGGSPDLDYRATRSASSAVGTSVSFGGTAEIVADVQAWVEDPRSNFGWLIKDSLEVATNQTARRLASRELASAKPEF